MRKVSVFKTSVSLVRSLKPNKPRLHSLQAFRQVLPRDSGIISDVNSQPVPTINVNEVHCSYPCLLTNRMEQASYNYWLYEPYTKSVYNFFKYNPF